MGFTENTIIAPHVWLRIVKDADPLLVAPWPEGLPVGQVMLIGSYHIFGFGLVNSHRMSSPTSIFPLQSHNTSPIIVMRRVSRYNQKRTLAEIRNNIVRGHSDSIEEMCLSSAIPPHIIVDSRLPHFRMHRWSNHYVHIKPIFRQQFRGSFKFGNTPSYHHNSATTRFFGATSTHPVSPKLSLIP